MGLSPTGISASIAAQALSSSTSCRFSPAHKYLDYAHQLFASRRRRRRLSFISSGATTLGTRRAIVEIGLGPLEADLLLGSFGLDSRLGHPRAEPSMGEKSRFHELRVFARQNNLLAYGYLTGGGSAALTLAILRNDSNRACGRSTLTCRISGRGPETECCVVLVPV